MIGDATINMIKNPSWKSLHRKAGIFVHQMPTESCIAEGDFMEKLLFMDMRRPTKIYIIAERDTRGSQDPSHLDLSKSEAKKV